VKRRRLTPYTARGIRRVRCAYEGCGRGRGFANWKLCTGEFVAICWKHDVELHGVMLEVLGDRESKVKSAAYAARVITLVNAGKVPA
jgi:hypothetical protein